MPRRPPGGTPHRRARPHNLGPELLVFVEGEKTERLYLTAMIRRSETRVRVKIEREPGTPLQLVTRALERKEADAVLERRRRGRAYDEYWCVFDRDAHPSFAQAGRLAASGGIELAISNPCIELWFILHFRDHTAYLESHEACREAQTLLSCGKVLTEPAKDALFEARGIAARRAQNLDRQHARNLQPPGHNPSSSVRNLIAKISP